MHRLALALGRTRRELGRTMTYRELRTWGQYFTQEPQPNEYLADSRNALLCATLANGFRSVHAMFAKPGSDEKAFGLDDFRMLRRPDTIEVESKVTPDAEQGATVAPETLNWLVMMARNTETRKQPGAPE